MRILKDGIKCAKCGKVMNHEDEDKIGMIRGSINQKNQESNISGYQFYCIQHYDEICKSLEITKSDKKIPSNLSEAYWELYQKVLPIYKEKYQNFTEHAKQNRFFDRLKFLEQKINFDANKAIELDSHPDPKYESLCTKLMFEIIDASIRRYSSGQFNTDYPDALFNVLFWIFMNRVEELEDW